MTSKEHFRLYVFKSFKKNDFLKRLQMLKRTNIEHIEKENKQEKCGVICGQQKISDDQSLVS